MLALLNERKRMGVYDTETKTEVYNVPTKLALRFGSYCKHHKTSKTAMIRMIMDELIFTDIDQPLRRSIQQVGMKMNNFLGTFDGEPPSIEGHNMQGQKSFTFYKKQSDYNYMDRM